MSAPAAAASTPSLPLYVAHTLATDPRLDARLRVVLDQMGILHRAFPDNAPDEDSELETLHQMHSNVEKLTPAMNKPIEPPPRDDATITRLHVEGVLCLLVEPKARDRSKDRMPVMVYLHGGGWVWIAGTSAV